ncbi:MAG TPA: hypothetical protein VHO01_07585 [Jatrophihabitans sp.]|nr:hypothetical protein [Jatrophihabitans sp.]
MVAQSLPELLGLSDDAGPTEIRHAYEQAMRLATRSGDHRRAVELSRSYDLVDARLRERVFPAASSLSGCTGAPAPAGVATGQPHARVTTGHAERPRRGRLQHPLSPTTRDEAAVWGRRLLAGAVGVALAVLVASYLWRVEYPHGPAGPRPEPSHRIAQRTDPVLVVPPDAPLDYSGLATIACAGTGDTGGFTMQGRPGDRITCSNGAQPQLIGG